MSAPATIIRCPHCSKSLGGPATDGGGKLRVRLGIVIVDPDGSVHGPCPFCKSDVQVTGAESPSMEVVKAQPRRIIPVLRVARA